MSDNHDGGAPPAPAPKNATRVMTIVLAALVVVALLAWFLVGNRRAPGPLATENVQSQTEQAFEDTVVVNPDGSFHYTPDPGFSGIDAFAYQVADGTGFVSGSTVRIEVRQEVQMLDKKVIVDILNPLHDLHRQP